MAITRAVVGDPIAAPAYNELVDILEAGYTRGAQVVYNASGTFSKASYPGLRAVRARVVGGGGAGGGGASTTSTTFVGAAGGGGGGGYAETLITDIAAMPSSVTVTVGAGGTGVSGTAGNDGGNSSFGSYAIGPGGKGGLIRAAAAGFRVASGGAGGSPLTGQFLVPGGAGSVGVGDQSGDVSSGGGGDTLLAGASVSTNGLDPASTGNLYGGGGSGNSTPPGTAARTGYAGAPGVVIVDLFF